MLSLFPCQNLACAKAFPGMAQELSHKQWGSLILARLSYPCQQPKTLDLAVHQKAKSSHSYSPVISVGTTIQHYAANVIFFYGLAPSLLLLMASLGNTILVQPAINM